MRCSIISSRQPSANFEIVKALLATISSHVRSAIASTGLFVVGLSALITGGAGGNNSAEQPRTVFHRALEAVTLTWSNAHLQAILRGDVSSSYSCHGCHGTRGAYRHGDGATHSVCVKHDVAGRLIWTGMFAG